MYRQLSKVFRNFILSSWSWSHDSWIYNYLSQSVPMTTRVIKLWIQFQFVYSLLYLIKLLSDKVCICKWREADRWLFPGGMVRMIVGFITIYRNQCLWPLELWVRITLRRDVLDTILCDQVCQWFSLGTPVYRPHQSNWPPRYNWNIVESGGFWILLITDGTSTNAISL
jgi:hypothetical protein